jgi:HD-GYP domain-containing protein (c-di-GMP phosphodiesterase class II)
MPLRSPLRIHHRFAVLTAGFLFAGIILFGGAAHLEVRGSAVDLASERLEAVTGEIAELMGASTAALRRQVAGLAGDSSVQALLKDPSNPQRVAGVTSLPGLGTGTGPTVVTQLWDRSGRLVYTSGGEPPPNAADVLRDMTESLRGDARVATGWLQRQADGLMYPIAARSEAGDTVVGYVLQWRRITSSDREREQLNGLIGSNAVIELGNTRGDLWTDLLRDIELPPIDLTSIRRPTRYTHGDRGAQLVYAQPIASTPWTVAIEFPLRQVLEPSTRTLQHLALVAIALMLVGAYISWRAGAALTHPIAELVAATKDIRAGDYSTRVRPGRRDELGELARQFNEMAAAVAGSQTEAGQQLERIRSLRAIDLAILGSTDLKLALKTVVAETRDRLRVDVASVMLFNPETFMIEMAACVGMTTSEMPRFRVRLGEGVTGRAALERQTVCFPDLTREAPQDLSPLAVREGLRALYLVPLIAKGQLVGLLGVGHRTALEPKQEWLDFLEALAGQAAMAIDSSKSFEALQRSHLELALAYDTTIEGWSRALDLRDKETEGHTQRVAAATVKMARLAGMSETELVHARRGALLHDIGKMGIPDAVLLKPGPLTAEEWVLMRKHPTFALELLSPIPYLRPALDIPYAHHEKWDGSGYPRGLRGAEIPWAARLFAVVDVWDALRSDRPYRKGWDHERICAHLRGQAGKHFDPMALELFFRMVHDSGDPPPVQDHRDFNEVPGVEVVVGR